MLNKQREIQEAIQVGGLLASTKVITERLEKFDAFQRDAYRNGGVFISYSHVDKNVVLRISECFEVDKISYWLDDKDMLVGQVIDKSISDGIQKNLLFLVVLSPVSVNSKWVEREFDEASYEEIENKKVILPIIVNGLKNANIPARIRRKLYVNLTDDFEAGYKKLRKSIFSYMIEYGKKKKI